MPTPPIAAPPPSRRVAVALSVLLAALLNAGALGLAGGLVVHGTPHAVRPQAPPLRARVVVLTPAPQPAAPLPNPASPRADAATPAAEPPTVPEARVPELAPATPETLLPLPPAAEQPLRLYGFDEVDVAAEPEDDWAIDVAALDAAGVSRLVFEVLVDDRGTVIGCTVLDPTGLDDAVRFGLEQRLAATRLRPAERGGRRVASVRRIELQVEDVPAN